MKLSPRFVIGLAISAAFIVGLQPWKSDSAKPLAGIASVIDADTIELHGTRIRLIGIDAPEDGQTCELNGQPWRCGQAAAFAVAGYIGRPAKWLKTESR